MKHVLVVGGSGFVGQMLVRAFVSIDWRVSVFDIRTGVFDHENVRYYPVDVQSGKLPTLPLCDAVINLAGATINHRLTAEYKKLIWSSRVISTRSLRQWLENQSWQPSVYIGASATGYYGNRNNEMLSANNKPGDDILARICIDWEREHRAFEKLSIPTIILRQGHVLGNGGLLSTLLPWFQRKITVTLGSGNYYMPWIDIRDLVTIYVTAAQGMIEPGIYAATSPNHILCKDMNRILALLTGAIIPFSVPVWLLRIFYGELADQLVASQRVQTSEKLLPYLRHTDIAASLTYWVDISRKP